MIRLLLETATEVCSVAVADGARVLAEHTAKQPNQHSSHLTLFIRHVMEEAQLQMTDLDEVILSDGPGSFTSLRVGAATAKGLCVALPGLRLRTVPTLLSLAVSAESPGLTLATINSRRGEVYGQLFSETDPLTEVLNLRMAGDDVLRNVLLDQGEASVTVCGPGRDRFATAEWLSEHHWESVLKNGGFAPPQVCSASSMLPLASLRATSSLQDPATYEPFYLNPPFVTKSKKKPLG